MERSDRRILFGGRAANSINPLQACQWALQERYNMWPGRGLFQSKAMTFRQRAPMRGIGGSLRRKFSNSRFHRYPARPGADLERTRLPSRTTTLGQLQPRDHGDASGARIEIKRSKGHPVEVRCSHRLTGSPAGRRLAASLSSRSCRCASRNRCRKRALSCMFSACHPRHTCSSLDMPFLSLLKILNLAGHPKSKTAQTRYFEGSRWRGPRSFACPP
jgi:hypothetical protein